MGNNNRRKALKALAVGAPAVWAKPVVDSVVLPAHASTTCPLSCNNLVVEILLNTNEITSPTQEVTIQLRATNNSCESYDTFDQWAQFSVPAGYGVHLGDLWDAIGVIDPQQTATSAVGSGVVSNCLSNGTARFLFEARINDVEDCGAIVVEPSCTFGI